MAPAQTFDPNLKNDYIGTDVFVTLTIFIILITLSTGTRIITKIWVKAPLRVDDYFCLLGYALNTTGIALDYMLLKCGFGRHAQFLPADEFLEFRKYAQFALLVATMALWAVKMSICVFLLSLIRSVHARARMVIYGLIALTTITSVSQIGFWATQAYPLNKIWQPWVKGHYAAEEVLVVSIITFTAINSLVDLFYALSPLYFFGGLQMTWKNKITIMALTGMGLVVFTIALVRASYAREFLDHDATWALHKVYILTIYERCLAEVIADLPAIYPHVRSLSKKAVTLISTHARGTTTNGYAGGTAHTPRATIDDVTKPKSARINPFAAYGKAAQFSQFTQIKAADDDNRKWSDDALPLKGMDPERTHHDDLEASNGIRVKTSVEVLTEEAKSVG